MKSLIIIYTLFLQIGINKSVGIRFYDKGELQNNLKVYLVQPDRSCIFLGTDNLVRLPDTLTTEDIDLYIISGKHKIVCPVFDWKECDEILIDHDSRLFKNVVKQKYGFSSFSRSKYYIKQTTVVDIITVGKPKKAYTFK